MTYSPIRTGNTADTTVPYVRMVFNSKHVSCNEINENDGEEGGGVYNVPLRPHRKGTHENASYCIHSCNTTGQSPKRYTLSIKQDYTVQFDGLCHTDKSTTHIPNKP